MPILRIVEKMESWHLLTRFNISDSRSLSRADEFMLVTTD